MFLCTRTTIDIDEPVFRELKQEAVRRKTTLRKVVNACLSKGLTTATRQDKYVFRWKPQRGRIQPGVRLDDRDSLFHLMDGR